MTSSETQTCRTQTPFSLRIFVADGDPDGLRLVERSNWIGKAVIFPRAIYTQVRTRAEFQQTGVYLLLGPRTDADGDQMYIGEGDPVRPRLEEHYAKKDFWTRAVFFVAGATQLNKAHVQYLESELVRVAKEARRTQLANGNIPGAPTLSEADKADMDVFLQNMLGILPVLGIDAFDLAPVTSAGEANNVPLYCKARGANATGFDTPRGFVVKEGSLASKSETKSLADWFPSIVELRAEFVKTGVFEDIGTHYRFTQDYTFGSPSAASAVVLGSSSNGRVDWKDASGKTLKAIQESQAETTED